MLQMGKFSDGPMTYVARNPLLEDFGRVKFQGFQMLGFDCLGRIERKRKKESADKPGSVVDDHSSGTPVAGRL